MSVWPLNHHPTLPSPRPRIPGRRNFVVHVGLRHVLCAGASKNAPGLLPWLVIRLWVAISNLSSLGVSGKREFIHQLSERTTQKAIL